MNNNDKPSSIYTDPFAILAMGEKDRQTQEAQMGKDRAIADNQRLSEEKRKVEQNLANQTHKSKELVDSNDQYQWLLHQPLNFIATQHIVFNKNYEDLLLDQAEWMASQRSYKELAIRLGEKLGMSPQDVIELQPDILNDVLNNKNNSNHNTNCSAFLQNRSVEIKNRIQANKEKFIKEYTESVSNKKMYHLFEENTIPKNWNQAFNGWMKLSENNRQAQYNIGRAFHFGISVGVDFKKAEEWYVKSLNQNEPCAAYNLFLLYKTEKFSKLDLIKAKEFLYLAIKMEEPRAPEALIAFETNQKEVIWKREEPELLKQLKTINEGVFPTELFEKIKGRGYEWEDDALILHSSIYNFIVNKRNKGTFFKPNFVATLHISVHNPTKFQTAIYMSLNHSNSPLTIRIEPTAEAKGFGGHYNIGDVIKSFIIVFPYKYKMRPGMIFTYIPKNTIFIK